MYFYLLVFVCLFVCRRAHSLTTLFLLIVVLVYVALIENEMSGEQVEISRYNAKRGLVAVVAFFVLLGVTVIPDGPFLRPHPAFWRLMFCLSIVYLLSLIFVLFQVSTIIKKSRL
jgi:phosphatidylserine synthase 2